MNAATITRVAAVVCSLLPLTACRIGLGLDTQPVPEDFARPPDLRGTSGDMAGTPVDGAFSGLPGVEVGKYFVGQTCGMNPAADPVEAFLDLQLVNPGQGSIGPVRILGGRIVEQPSGLTLLAWDVAPTSDFTLGPGERKDLQLAKTAGSGRPANGCQTLRCDAIVRVVIDWSVAGITNLQSTASADTSVTCK